MKQLFIVLLLISVIVPSTYSQQKTDSLLEQMFRESKDTLLQAVTSQPEKYRLQIIYTEINRDEKNKPILRNYYFNYDPHLYYNPASTVKLPLAILALEKLNHMKAKGVDKNTSMQFDSSYERQTIAYIDSTSANGLPSIAHYIKKAFLISDNDAYNRLYQFTGQATIHLRLKQLGYTETRIPRQFMGFTMEQNRHTNQVRFINKNSKTIYTQPPAYNTDSFNFSRTIKVGTGHMNRNDSLVNEPFDFTIHNNIPLDELRRMLQAIMIPYTLPADQRFNLSVSDYKFLKQYLSQYSSETSYPKYDTTEFYDSYVKFFFRDSTRKMPEGVRVFNKVGWAYGFLTDVSYVVDFKNNLEYMLSATIYVNEDGILNDNKYEFDSVGYPFLRSLGKTIYDYERSRSRVHTPNLNEFRMNYEKRDVRDNRLSIKLVDN